MKYTIRNKQSQSYDKGRNGEGISSLILHYTAASFTTSLNVLVNKIYKQARIILFLTLRNNRILRRNL